MQPTLMTVKCTPKNFKTLVTLSPTPILFMKEIITPMRLTLILFLSLFLYGCSSAQLKGFDRVVSDAKKNLPLSNEDVGNGLKQALEAGISKGADALARPDGYLKSPYKILLPAEAQTVVSKLSTVPGFTNLESDLTERVNRAAEDAATRAKPIFVHAIRSLTIQDAMNILMGQPNAATQFLDRTTRQQLYNAFQPVIHESLEKVHAISLWSSAASTYNRLPLVQRVDTQLDNHVTVKALDGLFAKIEEEEKHIRNNPSARSTDLMRRVFARQDR
jgi:hypothetical protein